MHSPGKVVLAIAERGGFPIAFPNEGKFIGQVTGALAVESGR